MAREYADLDEKWKAEKASVAGSAGVKEELERAKQDFEVALRAGDHARASEIRYGRIPELERKLARHVEDQPGASAAAQIAAALDELAARGLLSEARTAESVLLSQGRRHGVRRLKQTLQGKGLASELVAQTLQQARVTELDRAREVWRRRFGTPPTDAAERARQMLERRR